MRRAPSQGADAGAALPEAAKEKAVRLIEAHQDNVRRAHEAGVRIAMGTDCGVGEHGTNLDELEMMRALGMSATEVLYATTGSSADLLGVETDRGRLEPGCALTSSWWRAAPATSPTSPPGYAASTSMACRSHRGKIA